MRHNYKAIFAYDTATNKVGACKFLGTVYLFNSELLDTVFKKIYRQADFSKEVVIGITLTNDVYQISKDYWYIKEDFYTAKNLDKGKMLSALSKKAKELNISQEL